MFRRYLLQKAQSFADLQTYPLGRRLKASAQSNSMVMLDIQGDFDLCPSLAVISVIVSIYEDVVKLTINLPFGDVMS